MEDEFEAYFKCGLLEHGFLQVKGVAPNRAERLALTVLGSLEGALIMARSKHSPTPIDEIGHEVTQWVAASLPAGAPGAD